VINPRRSSSTIMLWTLGGVTPKKRWMSASAGGRPLISVYAWMKASYWPWISVKRGGGEVAMLLAI
jgi:hypothetical protein